MLDFEKRKVTREGTTIDLTVKEFELLALFARTPGRTYSRTDLLNLVWGYQFEGYEHTVNSHINRLRGKIEADPGHPRYLKTVWGVGYRFAEAVGARDLREADDAVRRIARSLPSTRACPRSSFCSFSSSAPGCVAIAFRSSQHLFDDVEQLLNREYARSIADELRPLVAGGFSEERVKGAIHYMMVLNPMVEIYLLDARGRILAYFLNPAEKIARASVDLAPVQDFVRSAGHRLVPGRGPAQRDALTAVLRRAPADGP